jgi:hypothetical protein
VDLLLGGLNNQGRLIPGHRTGSPARGAYTRHGRRSSRLAQRPGIGRDSGNSRTAARYQGRWPWPRHAPLQSCRAGRRWFRRSENTGRAGHRRVTPRCRATTRTTTASSTATRFLSSALSVAGQPSQVVRTEAVRRPGACWAGSGGKVQFGGMDPGGSGVPAANT